MSIRWKTTKFRKLRQQKEIAERRRVSMREVSEATGIIWRTIQRYETRDQLNPDPATVQKLALYYGTTLDAIVIVEDEETANSPKLMAEPA